MSWGGGPGEGAPSPDVLATKIAGRPVVVAGVMPGRQGRMSDTPPPRSPPRWSHSSLTGCPGPRRAGHGRWRGGDAPSARAASLASSAALPAHRAAASPGPTPGRRPYGNPYGIPCATDGVPHPSRVAASALVMPPRGEWSGHAARAACGGHLEPDLVATQSDRAWLGLLIHMDRSGLAAAANTQETDIGREETDVTSRAPTRGRVNGRLRLAVAGAVVLTALTTAAAAAVVPPVEAQALQTPRLGVGASPPPRHHHRVERRDRSRQDRRQRCRQPPYPDAWVRAGPGPGPFSWL